MWHWLNGKRRSSAGFPSQGRRGLFRSICEPAICIHQIYLLALAVQKGLCISPAEKSETGTGDLACEMWDLERLYLTLQPLILKMASADLMQMAAWNTQLTIERIFLFKKGKQKQMFGVLQILNGKICNIEAGVVNYREMMTLIACCLFCTYHPLFLKTQGCYLHVSCSQGSISLVGQSRLLNYILLWKRITNSHLCFKIYPSFIQLYQLHYVCLVWGLV